MTPAGAAQARSSKNAMESARVIEAIQAVVVSPSVYGSLWLGVVSLVGELIAPFPSSLVFAGQLIFLKDVLSAGMIAKLILFIAVPMAIGTTIGSLFTYGIAYAGGRPAIEKLKKYIRFSWQDVERFESQFTKNWYDEFLFLALRCIPLLPTIPINVLAGILRMSPAKYALLTVLGTTVRLSLMLIIFGIGIMSI
jgi:membrane protein YqaA with SNARE-associated domain